MSATMVKTSDYYGKSSDHVNGGSHTLEMSATDTVAVIYNAPTDELPSIIKANIALDTLIKLGGHTRNATISDTNASNQTAYQQLVALNGGTDY